jgi:hypothetical protein
MNMLVILDNKRIQAENEYKYFSFTVRTLTFDRRNQLL